MTHDLHSPSPLCHLLQVANIGPPPIGFNVSHDNELVAMAFAPGEFGPPAFLIGVDVMRVRVPTGGLEGAALFLRAVGETTMRRSALSQVTCPRTKRFPAFFLIWTIKEAYIKAIGLGLVFDPSRIEYDMPTNTVAVDGVLATGWRFETSEVTVDEEEYRVTVAQFVGSGDGSGTVVPLVQGQIVCTGASDFVRKALGQFRGLE